MYKVYIRVDKSGNIVAINSDAFIQDFTGWVEIDSGLGDKFHHAQGHYFDKPIMTMDGVYRYKLVGNKPKEKTSAEIEADMPTPVLSFADVIKQKYKDKAKIKPLTDKERLARLEELAGVD